MSQQSEKNRERISCQQSSRQGQILHTLVICTALVLTTIIAFEPIRHNGFVYDDILYITQNPEVTAGLTVDSIRWAFTTTYAGNWHPVTLLSHMLDCELFGLNPFLHHLTNLGFHIVNTLLLFCILKSMTGALWRSAFVAAAFALHPVHVESVAWAAERKDLLCGFFWMLTIAAYIRYARKPGTGRYLPMLIVFVLGLLAKPMIVTLPFVLLLLDYWPLARFEKLQPDITSSFSQSAAADGRYEKASTWFLLMEKLPLLILVIISSIIAFVAQQERGAMGMLEHLPFNVRMANALISYTTYISKVIYPSYLAVMYPHPGGEFELWHALGSLGIVVLVTIIVIRLGRHKPYLLLGWLWYLGALVPVIGLVQIGAQGMADRYTYLPSIGFFIIVTWGAVELAGRWRFLKIVLPISAGIIIALLIVCTRKQVQYWKSNFTLFERAFVVTRKNPTVLYNLGVVMQTEQEIDLALECYRQALQYKSDYFQAYNNIGGILSQQGHLEQADNNIRKALQINHSYPQAHNNLGLVLVKQNKLDMAIIQFRQALELMPDYVKARHNLAFALQAKGEFNEAVSHYRKVLQLDPAYLSSLNALAQILLLHPTAELRNATEAVLLAERAAKLTRYRNPMILDTLAAAYAVTGQFDRAVAITQKAIGLVPAANNDKAVNRLHKELEMYKQGKLPEELIQKQNTNHQ